MTKNTKNSIIFFGFYMLILVLGHGIWIQDVNSNKNTKMQERIDNEQKN